MSAEQPVAIALRALGLGDFLAAVPAYRALRRALPEHRLVLAAPGVFAPLVSLTRTIDTLLPTAELACPRWTGSPPDVAVDLHGNGPASRDVLRRLRPERLVGYASHTLPDADGPSWIDEEPERQRWCRLVAATFGGTVDADDVVLASPSVSSPRPGCVIVHPGAAYAARCWPVRRFAAVARGVAGDIDVVVTGTLAERPLARRCAAAAGLPPSAVLAGNTDLQRLAALVAGAALVVCGDTGVGHLASAFRTPSVLLFGPTPPALWGPPNHPRHVVLWHGTGRTDPWGARPGPELMAIEPDEVIAAVRRKLALRY